MASAPPALSSNISIRSLLARIFATSIVRVIITLCLFVPLAHNLPGLYARDRATRAHARNHVKTRSLILAAALLLWGRGADRLRRGT